MTESTICGKANLSMAGEGMGGGMKWKWVEGGGGQLAIGCLSVNSTLKSDRLFHANRGYY